MTLEIDGHEFPFEDRKSESTDKTWVWDAPADLHDPATNFPVGSTATVCLYTEGNACPTNTAPSFSSSATFDAAENQTTAGTVLATDSDADDDITGYAITGGADEALFEIGGDGRRPDVQDGAELRGPERFRHRQHLRGGGDGDERRGDAGEDGDADDHGDGDGREHGGAGQAGRAYGVGGVGVEPDGELGGAG